MSVTKCVRGRKAPVSCNISKSALAPLILAVAIAQAFGATQTNTAGDGSPGVSGSSPGQAGGLGGAWGASVADTGANTDNAAAARNGGSATANAVTGPVSGAAVSNASAQGGSGGAAGSPGADGGAGQGLGASGGHGASATISASSQSTDSHGYATANATGGNGGAGYYGAAGGHGAGVTLSNNVTGSTSGGLTLVQSAIGGDGGTSDSGVAGNGGHASSSLNVINFLASSLSGAVNARGGNGGGTSSGTVGTAGSALATLSLSVNRAGSGAQGQATALSSARSLTDGGNAQSNASAYCGAVTASAQSFAVLLGSATSNALAQGNSGTAWAGSHSNGDLGRTLDRTAQAPVGSTARAGTSTSFAGSLVSLPSLAGGSNNDLGAFSYADGGASPLNLASVLGSHPRVADSITPQSLQVLGNGALGARAAADAGTEHDYTATAHYTFTLAPSSPLVLGLLDFSGVDAGQPLGINFSVTNFGTPLISESFTSLSTAESYFSDHALALGSFSGSVDLTLNFTLSGSAGQGADFSYLLASGALTNPVPERAQWAAMLLGLAWACWRRWPSVALAPGAHKPPALPPAAHKTRQSDR